MGRGAGKERKGRARIPSKVEAFFGRKQKLYYFITPIYPLKMPSPFQGAISLKDSAKWGWAEGHGRLEKVTPFIKGK